MPALRPTPLPVRLWRCLRLATHFLVIAAGILFVFPFVSPARQRALKRRWSQGILDILAVRLENDIVNAPPGSLIVANHISWLDIFAINALRPAAFIAKAEIRHWPFIGWICARNSTVFLQRGSHGHAREVNQTIDTLLKTGCDVAVFPEGTTSDGSTMHGFHAALLQPAISRGCHVIPLALSYHDSDGRRSLAPSYAGETTLRQCFAAILACRTLVVRIQAAPAIASSGTTRREIAALAHDAIRSRLGYPRRTSSGNASI